jgi:hypothetical protein
MSRGVFRSNNKEDEVFYFKTNASSGDTFNPGISINSPKRVHWDFGDGSSYYAGTFGTHTFNDSGTTKNCKFIGDDFSSITSIAFIFDKIVGDININSRFTNLQSINVSSNSGLTGLTIDYLDTPTSVSCFLCGLSGDLDLTKIKLKGSNRFDSNNLTSISHTASTENITAYWAYSNNLTGNHDMSTFPNLGGELRLQFNPSLTGVTHTASTEVFNIFYVFSCNLTGIYDISMLSGLGGQFQVNNNSNLTNIINPTSTQSFTRYWAQNCNLTNNLDLTTLTGLGGQFSVANNPSLTGISHTASTEIFSYYVANDCNITGNMDLSMFPNLGGYVWLFDNTNLTGVTHTTTTQNFSGGYLIDGCNLLGTHDISMLLNLSARFRCYDNTNLNNVLFPNSSGGTFSNTGTGAPASAFAMYNCDLGYVNFYPLSASTMDTSPSSLYGCSINLYDNNMTTSEVNQILTDFSGITTSNISGWSGVTLDISGTNAAPDNTSGGFDGIAAINYLTGVTAQWTIVTS